MKMGSILHKLNFAEDDLERMLYENLLSLL